MNYKEHLESIKRRPDFRRYPDNRDAFCIHEFNQTFKPHVIGNPSILFPVDNIFIDELNNVYFGNDIYKQVRLEGVIKKLLEIKNKYNKANVYLNLDSGNLVNVDFLNGPYVKLYDHIHYVMWYFSFIFDKSQNEYIRFGELISDLIGELKGDNFDITNKNHCQIVAEWISEFLRLLHPINALKLIQFFNYHDLYELTKPILDKYIKYCKENFKAWVDINNIKYIETCTNLLIDLERCKINNMAFCESDRVITWSNLPILAVEIKELENSLKSMKAAF